MIGTRLLHYQILEKLGEGGMGVVYRALDTHLDRIVAVKVLPEADPIRMHRFLQEARSASALNHPIIVTIYEANTADNVKFFAMEFVPGKTLRERLSGKALPVRDALKLAIAIADAL